MAKEFNLAQYLREFADWLEPIPAEWVEVDVTETKEALDLNEGVLAEGPQQATVDIRVRIKPPVRRELEREQGA